MAKFICPYCYGQHEENSYMICSHGCGRSGYYVNSEGYIKKENYSKCKRCSYVTGYRCPTTRNVIPLSCVVDSAGLTVALVGGEGSGKSTYIAVLINEIKRKMARGFQANINLNCTTETKQTYNSLYYEKIYGEHNVVDATDVYKIIPPMVFPVDFPHKKNVTLTVYDNACEKFKEIGFTDILLPGETREMYKIRNSYDTKKWFKAQKEIEPLYIQNANSIIVLIDPYQIPSVRKKLSAVSGIVLPPKKSGATAFDALDYVIELLEKEHGTYNKKFDADIAVVFTKMDALDGFDDILPEESGLKSDSEYVQRGAFVQSEFENTQAEISNMLEYVLEEGDLDMLTGRLSRFKNHALFAVSALGTIPQNSKIPEDEFKPRRVLDPLLWILKTNKYIKTIK